MPLVLQAGETLTVDERLAYVTDQFAPTGKYQRVSQPSRKAVGASSLENQLHAARISTTELKGALKSATRTPQRILGRQVIIVLAVKHMEADPGRLTQALLDRSRVMSGPLKRFPSERAGRARKERIGELELVVSTHSELQLRGRESLERGRNLLRKWMRSEPMLIVPTQTAQ